MDKDLWNKFQKHRKINKWDCIKLKSLFKAKETTE
jgi:hypothetical protein